VPPPSSSTAMAAMINKRPRRFGLVRRGFHSIVFTDPQILKPSNSQILKFRLSILYQ